MNLSNIIKNIEHIEVLNFKDVDIKWFIKNLNLVNPQSICDEIIKYALFKNGGVAIDDMTVMAVRLIEKS